MVRFAPMRGNPNRPIAFAPTFALALAALLALAGCAGGGEEEPSGGRTYTVRGQVRQLPSAGNPLISVAHEAIDDYVDRQGEKVGMDPMTMPFPVAEEVSLEGIATGDVVEFDLHVDWQSEDPVRVTAIRELPQGTRLEFRAAEPDQHDDH